MAVKQLAFDDGARAALLAGVNKVTDAVKSTLGPRGRTAILDKGWGAPTITKDGVTVAEEIELADKAENMGAKLVKEAASKTSDAAGDGTTTATVLAQTIFAEGLKNVTAGADAMALARGIRKAAEKVSAALTKMARPVDDTSVEDIIEIGRELTAAKKTLGHGHFLPWIDAEFGMSDQTARNLMNVHERFGKSKRLLDLEVSQEALYLLAAPSTEPEVVDAAMEKAEAGEKVGKAEVEEIKGWLKVDRRGTERTPVQGGDMWWIRYAEVRRFVVDNAVAVDIRKVDKFWFIDLLAGGTSS
ncbi:hypothetical protein LCGC14_2965200 [marine sediment metagenome]|uniref:60 kDa chaperonin n=1 Tax=marine sediment metagenome TaxID=412755 RepID=A0A0F8ZIS6_9ZZZZ